MRRLDTKNPSRPEGKEEAAHREESLLHSQASPSGRCGEGRAWKAVTTLPTQATVGTNKEAQTAGGREDRGPGHRSGKLQRETGIPGRERGLFKKSIL